MSFSKFRDAAEVRRPWRTAEGTATEAAIHATEPVPPVSFDSDKRPCPLSPRQSVLPQEAHRASRVRNGVQYLEEVQNMRRPIIASVGLARTSRARAHVSKGHVDRRAKP